MVPALARRAGPGDVVNTRSREVFRRGDALNVTGCQCLSVQTVKPLFGVALDVVAPASPTQTATMDAGALLVAYKLV